MSDNIRLARVHPSQIGCGGTFNAAGRWVPDATAGAPFYCHAMNGAAVRNGHKITKPGWYVVTADGDLRGPYLRKRLAAGAVTGMSDIP